MAYKGNRRSRGALCDICGRFCEGKSLSHAKVWCTHGVVVHSLQGHKRCITELARTQWACDHEVGA